jgi:type IV fimbrial biogenesis protein FimT
MLQMTALPNHRRAARGFTLIELAIVLAIAAILLRVAAPGMLRTVAARALAAQVSEFMAALRFARSEAIKRGAVVTLCAAAVQAPGCQSGRYADWRSGWIVFVDSGRHGALEPGDPLLRVQQPLQRSGGVAGTRAAISFTAAGYSADASSHFLFSPPAQATTADAPPALLVCVSKQGRPRLAGAGSCN